MEKPITNSSTTSNKNSRNLFYRYALSCNYRKFGPFVEYLKNKLIESEFKIVSFDDGENQIILLSFNNEERFLHEAQTSKLRKTQSKSNLSSFDLSLGLDVKILEQEQRKTFSYEFRNQYLSDSYYEMNYKHIIKNPKKNEDNPEKAENWGFGLFTESEMLYLELKLLKEIKFDKDEFMKLARENEKLSKKIDDIEKVLTNDDQLISVFGYYKIISDQTPIHISNFRNDIMKETIFSWRCPYRKIRTYFGDQVAIYFAWFYHYTRWLVIPSIFSILIMLFNVISPEISKVTLTIYALFLSIWSQIFLIYWSRKCSEIAIEWDNNTQAYDKDNIRREFKGEWIRSKVTGKFEKYYPSKKRAWKYLLTICSSIPVVLLSIFANIIFMNLSALIEVDHGSYFEIKYLTAKTKQEEIFDKNSFANTIINILYGIILSQINSIFEKIAEKTTNNENHRVQSNYENSLIYKRFTFEFFNYFITPFYLGFVIFNMEGLRKNMSSLYISNQISRVIEQLVIPTVKKFLTGKSKLRIAFSGGNKLENLQESSISQQDIIDQFKANQYQTYNDYLSVVLEFGNLVLFAEYFYQAPLLLLLFNTIELRIDIIGLCFFNRRPKPSRKRNIGSWKSILFMISCLSIFTNLFFSLFVVEDKTLLNTLNLSYYTGSARADISSLYLFFLLEHLVFIIIALINYLIKDVSPWVSLYLQRKDFKAKQNKWTGLIERLRMAKQIRDGKGEE